MTTFSPALAWSSSMPFIVLEKYWSRCSSLDTAQRQSYGKATRFLPGSYPNFISGSRSSPISVAACFTMGTLERAEMASMP
eukprot:scaffold190160_cov26-Tisochrysis_lutea.AAC.5